MNLNKCARCGCFFASSDDICPKCMPKDNFEISKLKDYLEQKTESISINSISVETGISAKNVNRYLGYEDFSSILDNLGNTKGNISINL